MLLMRTVRSDGHEMEFIAQNEWNKKYLHLKELTVLFFFSVKKKKRDTQMDAESGEHVCACTLFVVGPEIHAM